MKKTLLISIFLCVFTSSAWSLTVGINDVGYVDTWLASASLGDSGDATELLWVQGLLGNDITFQEKTDTSDGAGWLQTNEDARVFAFDFVNDNPEYFLVKIGAKPGYNDHFLFQNGSNIAWGVIDLDLNSIESIKNVGKLSHINEYNGAAPVPEPATLFLLGSGLLGLAGLKRKLNK